MSKVSINQSTDGNGREFRLNAPDQKHTVFIPAELLDDEVGDDCSDADRDAWVKNNIEEIVKAAESKIKGGVVRRPFDRIVVREDN